MNTPMLPDAARSILKSLIVSLGVAGIITSPDAELLIRLLKLDDA